MPDQALPHDLEAERTLLGACLVEPSQVAAVRALVSPYSFYRTSHGEIWRVILELHDAGSAVDLVTVCSLLRGQHRLDSIGGDASLGPALIGAPYIASLMDGVPKATHAPSYAFTVAEKHHRRDVIKHASRLLEAAQNGTTGEELRGYLSDLEDLSTQGAVPLPRAIDLYSAGVRPERPEFTVANFIRRHGLHVAWAEPSAGKTWTLLRICHELMMATPRGRLLGHPDLWINRRWKKVLWIATEEDAGALRYKADWIRRGLGIPPDPGALAGEIRYLWAPQPGRRITLDDLPAILEQEAPLDAVILDSLTGLRPRMVNGERVKWDMDNDALNEMNLRLRGLAGIHQVAIFIVHHTPKDLQGRRTGPRGGIDLEASADVMFGFIPDEGRTKVSIGKNRDGRKLPPFLLQPSWEGDRYDVEYIGPSVTAKLSPTALKVQGLWSGALSQGKRLMSQNEIVMGLPDVSRAMVRKAIGQLVEAGAMYDTGVRTPPPGASVLYGYGPGKVSDSAFGASEGLGADPDGPEEAEPADIINRGGTVAPFEVPPYAEENGGTDDVPW